MTKKISINELNRLTTSTALLAGVPISYGGNVYRVFDRWINYMPRDKYAQDIDGHNASPAGWYALLRIA